MKDVKTLVQEKYGSIVLEQEKGNEASCCSSSCCGDDITNAAAPLVEGYDKLQGYNEDADLGLGCGMPTEFAQIKKGDVVVDLGSGAGNDAFVARAETGETGRVIGVDFTEPMVAKAKKNATKLGFDNVEFFHGDLENNPLPENTADVVVSNCVFNLVPDKPKAFSETYRILKPGGHFSISDIVTEGELPEALKKDAELYVGCVAGALQTEEYLDIIHKAGFQNITIQKQKPIHIPNEILGKYFSKADILKFNKEQGIYSITVYAEKAN